MIWVNGVQINPGDQNLTVTTTPWVTDNLVRDYPDWAGVNAHANGNTDYVGNLPNVPAPRTWVRYAPAGNALMHGVATINILGEDHRHVRLEHVRVATGFNSFIVETFSSDPLVPGHFKQAYDTENAARFVTFGINNIANRAPYGCESLYPKIAFICALVAEYLPAAGGVALLSDRVVYVGEPALRYVKIGWGLARDVRQQVLNNPGGATPQQTAVSNFVGANAGLTAFLGGLPVDDYLGDHLTGAGAAQIAPVTGLCNVLVGLLIARSANDGDLSPAQQNRLNQLPHTNFQERMTKFGDWRNMHFVNRVTHAAAHGVRYAGMGQQHLLHLQQNNVFPANGRPYDMTPTGNAWTGFRDHTQNLWDNHH